MPKKAIIAGAACLGIILGLTLCFRAVPRHSRTQPEYHHAPGWKVEVVAEAPRLVYPTAIAVAPDGRVFVGQDPIDMIGPADQPIDSVLCFHPNGRITLFATNLHCVFGLQYLDGKLFVNHAPKLSVFTDRDSVGTERVDLFDYTNPRQLMVGALTHIPAGIHWAMDGFIYMAVGDAGVYNLKSKDGQTLSLQGGGIIRFRPDGTELETYSSGTRNHPDLAFTAEGEIFTYDNTDDGQGWWTRVTHMVDGGFYGYPWDYQPRRPYTLWMMGDYGGGSGTAALSYNEDALPADFRENLFLGDYARSQLLRLQVAREGATYRILRREMHNDLDFVTRGASDFRPIGIAVSPDGMAFYVTDWNTDLALTDAVTGRLLKLSYTGKSQAAPRPEWVPLAGTGKSFNATTGELLAALQHPAESVRLIAQRRLAERGAEVAPALTRLLENRIAPAPARWSAIWTLDALDGGVAARRAILAALKDADASVRRQAARQLGTRKTTVALTNLIDALKDSDASVRFQAATALGRIDSPAAVPALHEALAEKDSFARYAAFTALNRIGVAHPEAWREIAAGLYSSKREIREGVGFAFRETYSAPLILLLCAYATNAANAMDTRLAVVETLGELARQPPEWQGDWWGATGFNPASRPRPAKSQDWEGTPAATAALREALKDSQPPIRRVAVAGLRRSREIAACEVLHEVFFREPDFAVANEILTTLGDLKDPQFIQLFARMVTNESSFHSLLPGAIAAAEQVGSPAVVAVLTQLLGSQFGAQVRTNSVQALSKLKAESAIPSISKFIAEPDPNYWRSAIRALVQIGGDSAAETLAHKLAEPRPEVRQAIIDALGKLKSKAAVPSLITAYHDAASRSSALTVLTMIPDLRALEIYLDGLHSTDRREQNRCLKALAAIQSEAFPLIEERMEREHRELIPPELIPALQKFGGGFIVREWQCLGPLNDLSRESHLTTSHLSFDDTLVEGTGKKHRWRGIAGKPLSGQLNLCEQIKQQTAGTNSFLYLAARFARPEGQEMELTAVCPGAAGLVLWLNGARLSTYGESQQRIHRAAIKVNRGDNQLLVRIQNPQSVACFGVNLAPGRLRPVVSSPVQLPKETYEAWALHNNGNAARGRKWFAEAAGAGCIRCHRVQGEGGAIGPDLSGIGSKYTREQLIEAVLYPSRQILAGYHQTLVTTIDGDTTAGLIQREDDTTLSLLDASGQDHTIQKSQITHRKLSTVSPMPDGLHAGWNRREFCDVIEFLQSLKASSEANLK